MASNAPDLYPVDNSVCEIGHYCTNTNLELSTTPLANGGRNDDTTQLGPLRSQPLFQFNSDAYFVHLFLQ